MIIHGDNFESSNYAEAMLVPQDGGTVQVHVNDLHRFEAIDLVELAYFLARKGKQMDPDVDADYYFGEQFNDPRYVYGYSVDGVFDRPLEMARGIASSVEEAVVGILECADRTHILARWFIRDVARNVTVAAGGLDLEETIRLNVDRDYTVDMVA